MLAFAWQKNNTNGRSLGERFNTFRERQLQLQLDNSRLVRAARAAIHSELNKRSNIHQH